LYYEAPPLVSHVYGDNGAFTVTLTVTDDDGATDSATMTVTVDNVDPSAEILSASMDVEFDLLVSGRKYNNVALTLYEGNTAVGALEVERMPGDPASNPAFDTLPASLDMTKAYTAVVTFMPEDLGDGKMVGANPTKLAIGCGGTTIELSHTFNVQQSLVRDSDHWNHVEPWVINLGEALEGCSFDVTAQVTDPGSDDEYLYYYYGSQTAWAWYYNNGMSPDPYPSPDVNPVDLIDIQSFTYEHGEALTLDVYDDDGGYSTFFIPEIDDEVL
jgi:hypothetical protein